MSNPFLGEIRIFGFNFAPYGWSFCAGQTLPVSQNSALFSILGTAFGGNGTTNFQLPNLNGRAPLHAGQGPGLSPYVQGQTAGVPAVAIDQTGIPLHSHALNVANANANAVSPANNVLAKGGKADGREFTAYATYYATTSPDKTLAVTSISQVGQGQAHENTQPNLSLNFCIALSGVFPNRP